MKNKTLVLILLICLTIPNLVNAQISVGGGLVFGTDIDNLGISANAKYQIDEAWAAAPSFTLFLKKHYTTWSALDLDANYTFTKIENLGTIYGIGGLNVTFWKVKFNSVYDDWIGVNGSGSEIGVNVGAGINIALTDNITVAPEIKYTIGGANYARLGAKVLLSLPSKQN